MVKYLQKIYDRLNALKNGMTVNAASWTGQPDTTAEVDTKLSEITGKDAEIQLAKDAVSRKFAEARVLASDDSNYADGLENIAIGLHRDSKEKLVDYDIRLDLSRQPRPAPSMALTIILKDDTDGEGFIASLQTPDPLADNYEWEKGRGADPSDVNTIPQMIHLRITSRTTFLDDDVVKGVRYFYRVRAINSRGDGPWSSAVSRVQ